MSEEKFEDAAALEAWLKGKDVDPVKATAVSEALFNEGYDQPSTLIGITSADLKASGLKPAIAQSLSNKLKEPQPNGKLRCCSRIHFCIQLFFEYGNDSLFLYSNL
jgi:hypothetical protein